MSNTYSQVSVQLVFAVKHRQNFITDWRDELHRYITGVVKGAGGFPLATGGWKDHVHVFCANWWSSIGATSW